MMPKKEKLYEEGSIGHYAAIGFKNLKKLSESGLISEKLVGFNTLLFVLVIGVIISFWFSSPSETSSLTYFVVLIISLMVSLIISIGYAPIIDMASNFTQNKIEALRIGIMVLFIDLPVSVAGLVFRSDLVIKIAFGIIGFQFVAVIIGGLLNLSKGTPQDEVVQSGELWKILDKISIITGIAGFVVSIVMIFLK